MLAYFEHMILGKETIRQRVSALLGEFPEIDKVAMGFPRDLTE